MEKDKVVEIFRELVGDKADNLSGSFYPAYANTKITNALIKDYPDLKASRNFLELQKELANTEDRIQAARRFYNGNVRDLNTRIEIFPSNIIASLFRFQKAEYFEIEEISVKEFPKIKLNEKKE